MRGNLQKTTLAVLLRHLFAEKKSGTLSISSRDLERRIYFRKGAPVFADAGARENPPTRAQAEAILCSTFSWTAGEFSFEENEPDIDDKLALGKPPAELILEGSRAIGDALTLERFLGPTGTVFACTQTTELPLFNVKLSPAESAILKLARERERFVARDLQHVSGELTVLRALNSLVSLGLLEIASKVDAPAPTAKPAVAVESPPMPEPAPAVLEPMTVEALDSLPGEVEELFDRFEAKRVREQPPAQVPRVGIEETQDLSAIDMTQPLPVTRAAPARSRALVYFGLAAGVSLMAVTLVLSLSRGSRPSVEAETVDSAESAEPAAGNDVEETESSNPPAEPAAPTEAELFYQANLSFERGDFENARVELTALLERRPDFTAAESLLTRVEKELEASRAPAPKPASTSTAPPTPELKKEAEAKPMAPAKPDSAHVFDQARAAFQRGDLAITASKLDELAALDGAHAGARELKARLEQERWKGSLPRTYRARHDHRIGGCKGTVSLTAKGVGYRSSEHEWAWSFAELARAERKSELALAIETTAKKNYNFELEEPLRQSDWTRFLALGK